MSSRQGIQSIFSQRLDGAVFATYLLGAVVPLLGLGWVVQEYAFPAVAADSRATMGMLGAIGATAMLSLGSFFALRRITHTALARMDGDNHRLQQLLVMARSLPASAHASDATELASQAACELTDASAAFLIIGSGADKPMSINGASGARAGACEEAHGDALYELAAACFGSGVERSALDGDAVAIGIPLSCSSKLSGALVLVREGGDLAPEVLDAVETLAALTSVAIDNADLREAQRNFFTHVTDLLVTALDSHVDGRVSHANQVARLANRIGRELGVAEDQLQRLHFASLLHDLGMLKIPNDQQRNPAQFKRHPQIAHRLLTRIKLWEDLAPIVLHHHERWDGGGYPEGLAGESIPLEARIIHAADALDAMTRDDTHRHAMSHEAAVVELDRCAGTQFDPEVVAAVERIHERGELD